MSEGTDEYVELAAVLESAIEKQERSGIAADYIAVNLACKKAEFFDAEMYGVRRGAYTGAFEKKGHLEKRVVLLDEIGELSLDAQGRILLTLDPPYEYLPLGATQASYFDGKALFATNKNLFYEASEGNFRGDLAHRLHASFIRLRPLRERLSDIVPLFEHFVREQDRNLGIDVGNKETIIPGLLDQLWFGNAREVRNFVTSSLTRGNPILSPEDLMRFIENSSPGCPTNIPIPAPPLDATLIEFARFRKLQGVDRLAAVLRPEITLRDWCGVFQGKEAGRYYMNDVITFFKGVESSRYRELGGRSQLIHSLVVSDPAGGPPRQMEVTSSREYFKAVAPRRAAALDNSLAGPLSQLRDEINRLLADRTFQEQLQLDHQETLEQEVPEYGL